ncbi:MAG: hypothetical protein KBI40_06800 [Firmicutes bacterium]|jgi:hypothetical protein|nr:hypothetical protein [Candidatus Fermentithermobacillaceae bacterium]
MENEIAVEPEDMAIKAQTEYLKIDIEFTRLYGGLDVITGEADIYEAELLVLAGILGD